MRPLKNILQQKLKRIPDWILREDHASENDFLQKPEDSFTGFFSIFNQAWEEETTMKSFVNEKKDAVLRKNKGLQEN